VAPALAERTVARSVMRASTRRALIEDWVAAKYRLPCAKAFSNRTKDMAAAYRRLLHAGFKSGEILRVLKRFAKNPELLDAWNRRKGKRTRSETGLKWTRAL